MGSSSASAGTTKSGKPKCPPDYNANAGAAIGGAVAGSLGSAVGGLFGSKKKKPPTDCEPE
jgi:hypothetical protein